MTIYQEYLFIIAKTKQINDEKAKEIAPLNTRKTELIAEMYQANKAEYDAKDSGTINVTRGQYEVKIKKIIESKPTDLVAIEEVAPSCITRKTTISFSKTGYNKLPLEDKKKVDLFMESVEKQPTFEINELKEE